MRLIDASTLKYPNTFALVDDADFDMLNQWKWSPQNSISAIYIARQHMKKWVYMHRQIMNPGPGMMVDHINSNPLDNQRSNLRICDKYQNQYNQGVCKANTSGFKGVHASKKDNRWRAAIRFQRRTISLGVFPTAIQAALAYDEAAIKYHGEFARTNKDLGLITEEK